MYKHHDLCSPFVAIAGNQIASYPSRVRGEKHGLGMRLLISYHAPYRRHFFLKDTQIASVMIIWLTRCGILCRSVVCSIIVTSWYLIGLFHLTLCG